MMSLDVRAVITRGSLMTVEEVIIVILKVMVKVVVRVSARAYSQTYVECLVLGESFPFSQRVRSN